MKTGNLGRFVIVVIVCLAIVMCLFYSVLKLVEWADQRVIPTPFQSYQTSEAYETSRN